MTKITHHNSAGKPTACSQTAQNDLTAETLTAICRPLCQHSSPQSLKVILRLCVWTSVTLLPYHYQNHN